MKRKLLLVLGLLLSASFVKGQFSPFNRTINVNLDTTATVNGVNSKWYESPLSTSTSVQGQFFPFVKSAYKLRAISYQTDAEFTLASSKLTIKNSMSGLAKATVFNIQNATGIVKFSFDLDLSLYTGLKEFMIAFGNSSVSGATNLVNTNSLTSTPLADIFASFRIVKSGNLITQFRSADGSANTTTTPSTSLIKASQSQKVEIFVNSTSGSINYSYGTPASSVSLNSNTYHIYVDGVKYTQEFPKVGTTYSQTAINAISFAYASGSGTAGAEKVGISNIVITYQVETDPTLPVSLTSFTGENTASGIRLNWKTASEQNNSHFELLRAGEDKNFKFISRINGKGNSETVQNYIFNDNNPLNGNNYYQLKQVDFDGTETIFNQLVAVKSAFNNQNFKVSVSEESVLNAHIYATSYASGKIAVYDMSGKKIFEEQVSLQEGNNTISKALPAIQAGVYIARVLANGLNAETKFVKK
ncbi:T9SS type A sorting domain-containing protein [Pedobacter puniceum]|uniref:T9SS type A sorting domain-containing protein n=1 Tax=Pedobacter puniceum TaxID=2666136 RepID=A0A7K0FMC8_9SPHI|nr:T9SS type A sorting domain-containing protein [Pedobacter puniceum]MRX46821.1 T9SS type A sorting domain-containing protein [Pedobacter puniceum]